MNRKITSVVVLILACCLVAGAADYWGSKRSDKYHFPSCEWAQKISPTNKRVFGSVKEARGAGYVACKVCRPPSADASEGKQSARSRLWRLVWPGIEEPWK